MSSPEVLVQQTPQVCAEVVVASLIGTCVRVQASGGVPSVVLTGGSMGMRVQDWWARSPDVGLVDWARVDIWFGDERFVPAGSPDRNDGGATAVLLDGLGFDPARVHRMPTAPDDLDAAAARYGDDLVAAYGDSGPCFDVLMLGLGPDGHVASLFPGQFDPDEQRPVIGVRDSPKPPPERVSMSLHTLQRARKVWFVASGAEKADAFSHAVADDPGRPSGLVRGIEETRWFVDRELAEAATPTDRPD